MDNRSGTKSRTGTEKDNIMTKKTYSKPDIFFEDFSLSTNIAAGCELKPEGFTDNCYVIYGRYRLFSDNGICNRIIEEGRNEFDNLCYHVPYDFNVFHS